MVKKCLEEELKCPSLNIGRLYLMAQPKKIKKYNAKFPQFRITRPIAVNSVMTKLKELVLKSRIENAIIDVTSRNNAGFKPGRSTDVQLQRMQ